MLVSIPSNRRCILAATFRLRRSYTSTIAWNTDQHSAMSSKSVSMILIDIETSILNLPTPSSPTGSHSTGDELVSTIGSARRNILIFRNGSMCRYHQQVYKYHTVRDL